MRQKKNMEKRAFGLPSWAACTADSASGFTMRGIASFPNFPSGGLDTAAMLFAGKKTSKSGNTGAPSWVLGRRKPNL